MGVGLFDEPQPQVFQNGLNDLPVFDEADVCGAPHKSANVVVLEICKGDH